MKTFYKVLPKLFGSLLMILLSANFLLAQPSEAPGNLMVLAKGVDQVLISWDRVTDATGYKIMVSTDSVTFDEVANVSDTIRHYISDLTEGTDYDIHVLAYDATGDGPVSATEAMTVVKAMNVHLPLDALDGDTAIVEAISGEKAKFTGQLVLQDAAASGLGIPAIKFVQDELAGTQSWVDISHLINGNEFGTALTARSLSVWIKNDFPSIWSVPVSFEKRTGLAIAFKNDSIWVFTKHRIGSWYADGFGLAFNSTEWIHVAYVFHEPFTELYINGEMVGSIESIGSYPYPQEGIWPYPAAWQYGGDKSYELGCQNDPCAATVKFLGDTWDPGPRRFFMGSLADIRMYNYALSGDEIGTLFSDVVAKVDGASAVASGSSNVVLKWNDVAGETGYLIESSKDGVTWATAGNAAADEQVFVASGLDENTEYSFRITPEGIEGVVIPGEVTASTIEKIMGVHLEFNEIVGDTAIENSVDGSMDNTLFGELSIASVTDTLLMGGKQYELDFSSINFIQDELSGTQSYVRLTNTILPVAGALTERTVTFWMKDEQPSLWSAPISVCKRTGFSVVVKDGMIHGFTKQRPKFPTGDWAADSTGAAFASDGWVHVAYVFEHPVTKLYINGEMVDESEGIYFYSDGTTAPLSFPTDITVQAGGDKSAEIGCQLDPDAATVQFLGDTWDPGPRRFFNGSLGDMRMYNYALNGDEIMDVIDEVRTEVIIESVDEWRSAKFRAYPVPAADELYFSSTLDQGTVSIYDQTGRLALQEEVNNTRSLNISTLINGIYILKIEQGGITEIQQISVVK